MKNSILSNYKKYRLEPYTGQNSRHTCPQCGDKHSFTYYINIETGETLDKNVGRCNHESSCGYHCKPRNFDKFGYGCYSNYGDIYTSKYTPPKYETVSFFDEKHLVETEVNHAKNNFVNFLLSIYDYDIVSHTIDKYRIGTSNHWNGATVFWYIDSRNRICSGKVMQYDKVTGKRIKINNIPLVNSMRSILQKKGIIDIDFNQKKILYGEHLLINNIKPVNIVESEKTAIIASLEFPHFIWLASGSRSFLTKDRIKVLKGRDVTLYPDNDAYEDWARLANKYGFKLSTFLKENVSDSKSDLADYILSFYKL